MSAGKLTLKPFVETAVRSKVALASEKSSASRRRLQSSVRSAPAPTQDHRRILGINFFVGEARSAINRMRNGGLLIVPAAPALKDLPTDPGYREALLNADVTITDSAFMVLIWNLRERDHIRRVSGLKYLRLLLHYPEVRHPGNTFWIMANQQSAERNVRWLREHGIEPAPEDVYIAPMYGSVIQDEDLLARLRQRKPRNIIVTVGGGTQERLGYYLKQNLDYKPAIHCIGAAIAFLSGDQVRIPHWADLLFLGWLFRCVSQPSRFIPRYWNARKLLPLMLRYRSDLPAGAGLSHGTALTHNG